MKRRTISLAIVAVLLLCGAVWARMTAVMELGGQGSTTSATEYDHVLSLEDNAANTTVVNNGTATTACGGVCGDWEAGENTSGITSTTHYEGSRSFYQLYNTEWVRSTENWTSEKIEWTWYYYSGDVDYDAIRIHMGVGATNGGVLANEFEVRVLSGSTNFVLIGQGNTGSYGYKTTSDVSLSNNTWYELQVTLDASHSNWDMTFKYKEASASSWTTATLGSWQNSTPNAAVFNLPLYVGSTAYPVLGYIDYVRIRTLP